jgi:imidazolonepropionase-like amidohydrolase
MATTSPTFVLRHTRVLEQGGGFSDETSVLVQDGMVARIGRNVTPPDGAPEYDLSGLWLMPGVIDCHEHLGASTMDERELLRTPDSYSTLEAVVNLRKTLDAGVTFVRDAGGVDAGFRRAVDDGLVPGPRLQVSISLISQTGGHGDNYSVGLGIEPDPLFAPMMIVADGVDGVRLAVRRLLRDGADCIKLCTSGGVVSPHDTPWDVSFTVDEIAAAVSEAAARGKPVMTHAIAGEGIDRAVACGVRSIEHGTLLDERQAAAMAAAGCWLVPTLSVVRSVIDAADAADGQATFPAWALSKIEQLRDSYGACVQVAREAGVRIAVGCDWFDRRFHGRNLEEIALLHDAGMPLEETLLAATSGGAELCGVADRHGRVAPGFVFDAFVLGEDPSDVSVFRRPAAVLEVFKAGVGCKTGSTLLAERGPTPEVPHVVAE